LIQHLNNGQNGEQKRKFTPDELNAALLDMFDLLQRVLLDTYFVALGNTGKAIKENRPLDVDVLEFGVYKKFIIPEVRSTLKDWIKGDITENGFSHSYRGVPMYMRFVDKKNKYMEFADSRLYAGEFFRYPNPFDEYYKNQNI
jgi:hypothetical protein